jgi:hypothetical protein
VINRLREGYVCVGLHFIPTDQDFLGFLVNQGITAAIWPHRCDDLNTLREKVQDKIGSFHLAELPQAVHRMRSNLWGDEEMTEEEKMTHPCYHLSLLWDDPNRCLPTPRPVQDEDFFPGVVDCAAGMSIWQLILDELGRLLGYNGAFRSVRTWYLDTEEPTAVLLSGRRSQRPCKAEELIVPGGRRLILVASDCVGRAWHTGSVNNLLRVWSIASPVALLHLLPRHMWSGSALGRGRIVRLFARAPASSNSRLELVKTADAAADVDKAALKLPVLTLEPAAFAALAQVLNGKADTWIAGALFDTHSRYADPQARRPHEPTPELIQQRLQRFLEQASPQAQELAGYLSAAPLSLQVMRLVQRVLLPDSRQTDLAELVVSGLLRRVSRQDVHAHWLCLTTRGSMILR